MATEQKRRPRQFFDTFAVRPATDPVDRDFQRLRAAARSGAMVSGRALLILSCTADLEADLLSYALSRYGCHVLRWNVDDPAMRPLALLLRDGMLQFDGHEIELTFMRYFQRDTADVRVDDPAGGLARAQWPFFLGVMRDVAGDRALNALQGPGDISIARQLSAARTAGFGTPDSIVTTTVDARTIAAVAPDEPHDAIVKTLGPRMSRMAGVDYSVFPKRCSSDAQWFAGHQGAPVVVQRYQTSSREFRVYVVGGEVVTFSVEKSQPADVWHHPDVVRVAECAAGARLADAARTLTGHLRLDIAALDVLERGPELVFLEVNPVCDWLWFERRARSTAVTNAVITFLVRRLRRPASRPTEEGHT